MKTAIAVILVGLFGASTARAQRVAAATVPGSQLPKFDIGLGFNSTLANAPPGVSDNFPLTGGFAEGAYHFNRFLAADAQFTGEHANQISNLGQSLTLTTYMFGPQVELGGHRFVPFARALFGGAHGSDSYFPTATSFTTTATSFAYGFNGGVDFNLTSRLAWRVAEVGFLHTAFPNGSSNVERHLMVGTGIVLKFGGGHRERLAPPPPPPPPPPPVVPHPHGEIHFNCAMDKLEVAAGGKVMIMGNTTTEPDHMEVMYAWMPDGGMIEGSGANVRLNTAGMDPGHHIILGHAVALGENPVAADCKLELDVNPAPAPPPPPAPNAREVEFHANVPDAFFDYNSSALRPDALAASQTAATFLNTHRDITVRVEGFADERGSVPYNLILGQQRAVAARNALIKAGVAPNRIEIISFGKAAPVCKEATEECYRQNRRAAFSMRP